MRGQCRAGRLFRKVRGVLAAGASRDALKSGLIPDEAFAQPKARRQLDCIELRLRNVTMNARDADFAHRRKRDCTEQPHVIARLTESASASMANLIHSQNPG